MKATTVQKHVSTLKSAGWELHNTAVEAAAEAEPGVPTPYWITRGLAVAESFLPPNNRILRAVVLVVPQVDDYTTRADFVVFSADGYQITILREEKDEAIWVDERQIQYVPVTLQDRLQKAAGFVEFSSEEVKAIAALKLDILITNEKIFALSDDLDLVLSRSTKGKHDGMEEILEIAQKHIGADPIDIGQRITVNAETIQTILKQISKYGDDPRATIDFVPYKGDQMTRVRATLKIEKITIHAVSLVAPFIAIPIPHRDAPIDEPIKLSEISKTTKLFAEQGGHDDKEN